VDVGDGGFLDSERRGRGRPGLRLRLALGVWPDLDGGNGDDKEGDQ
jgi:hypothetical protein